MKSLSVEVSTRRLVFMPAVLFPDWKAHHLYSLLWPLVNASIMQVMVILLPLLLH